MHGGGTMCFRPSTVEQSVTCPECGKKINAVMGQVPVECPFCEADISALANVAMANAGDAAAGGSSLVTGIPGIPGASTVPGAPTVPPAVKPPTA